MDGDPHDGDQDLPGVLVAPRVVPDADENQPGFVVPSEEELWNGMKMFSKVSMIQVQLPHAVRSRHHEPVRD